MKLSPSPLELKSFQVFRSTATFSDDSEDEEIHVDDIISKYDIDLDFMIRRNENMFAIFTKVEVNFPSKSRGHSMQIDGLSIYSVPELLLHGENAKDLSMLINYSAIPLAFGNMRGYIATITSYTPTGSYMLPAFDMNDLLLKKNKKAKNRTVRPSPTKKGK